MIGDDERRALRDGIEAYASDRGVAVAEALWASVERPGALPRDGLLAVLSDELVFAPAGDPAGREPWRWRLPPVAALSPQPSLSGARATVDIDGEQLTVELPGGDEDLAALRAALAEAGPTVADAPYRAGGFEDTAEVPEDFEVLWDVHDDEPSDIGPPSDVWEEPERADLVPAAPGGVEAPASRSMLVIAAVAAAGGVVTLVFATWLLSAAGPASAPQAGARRRRRSRRWPPTRSPIPCCSRGLRGASRGCGSA